MKISEIILLSLKWFISCLSPCGWCKTRRVMVEQAENIWACSRIFRRLRHQWLAETFASTARGLSWFLSIHTTTGYVSREQFFYDNRNRKGNISCLCFMSLRDIPQLRPFFLLLSLSLLSSKIIRRFLSLSRTVVKKTQLGGALFFAVLFAHLRENV